jgi:hypothetical protein
VFHNPAFYPNATAPQTTSGAKTRHGPFRRPGRRGVLEGRDDAFATVSGLVASGT